MSEGMTHQRCLLITFILAFLGLTSARIAGTLQDVHVRTLKQFRPGLVFPYTRCGNLSRVGQPYYLYGPAWSADADGLTTYTFGVGYKGSRPDATECYKLLEASCYKVMINIYNECLPALQVGGMMAVVNRTKDTTLHAIHVYQYPLGGSLAISNLGLSNNTVQGTTISFRAAPPCNRPSLLFKPNTAKEVPIEYAFAESAARKCCGRSI